MYKSLGTGVIYSSSKGKDNAMADKLMYIPNNNTQY